MVKRNMKKYKSKKRQNQTEFSVSGMLIQSAAGVLIGVICAFALLVLSAVVLKLLTSGLNTGTGLVLAVKLVAAFIGTAFSVYRGDRLMWIRGLASGFFILSCINLILSCYVSVKWMQLLADAGLGAAIGLAAAGLFVIFKK